VNLRRERPLIYLISDGSVTDQNFVTNLESFLDLVDVAVSSDIPLIQIREKNLSASKLFDLSIQAAERTEGTRTRILINDRLDVAIASGAYGAHPRSTSVSPRVLRNFTGSDFVIGASAHSFDEAANAAHHGADFVVVGPVFKTGEKQDPIGIESLADIVSRLPNIPVLGIGGIDDSNFQNVLDAGAAGFAAIRFLNNVNDLKRLGSKF